MSDPDTANALRRKLGAPANPLEQAEMGPAKALRLAVARAAETCATLEAAVTGFAEQKLSLPDILTAVEDPHLIFMMRTDSGVTGLALWDPAALSAVIEHLITGRVVPSQNGTRAPTRTDAAVITEILDKIMELFDKSMDEALEKPPVVGFRTASLLADGRAVAMALEDIAYRHYRVTIDFASGVKSGDLRLIFPWARALPGGGARARRGAWDTDWPSIIKDARAPVEAVLYRMTLPLDQIAGLGVGDTLDIPVEAIDAVTIEGSDHRAVAAGRLGQCNGHRAVRLSNAGATPLAPAQPAQVANGATPEFQDIPHPPAAMPVLEASGAATPDDSAAASAPESQPAGEPVA